jgi:hypothetical protein
MEALISEKADRLGTKHEVFRTEFKTLLKSKGLIKESTSELDLEGYSKAIIMLQS